MSILDIEIKSHTTANQMINFDFFNSPLHTYSNYICDLIENLENIINELNFNDKLKDEINKSLQNKTYDIILDNEITSLFFESYYTTFGEIKNDFKKLANDIIHGRYNEILGKIKGILFTTQYIFEKLFDVYFHIFRILVNYKNENYIKSATLSGNIHNFLTAFSDIISGDISFNNNKYILQMYLINESVKIRNYDFTYFMASNNTDFENLNELLKFISKKHKDCIITFFKYNTTEIIDELFQTVTVSIKKEEGLKRIYDSIEIFQNYLSTFEKYIDNKIISTVLSYELKELNSSQFNVFLFEDVKISFEVFKMFYNIHKKYNTNKNYITHLIEATKFYCEYSELENLKKCDFHLKCLLEFLKVLGVKEDLGIIKNDLSLNDDLFYLISRYIKCIKHNSIDLNIVLSDIDEEFKETILTLSI